MTPEQRVQVHAAWSRAGEALKEILDVLTAQAATAPSAPEPTAAAAQADAHVHPELSRQLRPAMDPERIVEALRAIGRPASPQEIRAQLGAESHQITYHLHRLRASGKITATGRTRNRRYRLADIPAAGDPVSAPEPQPPPPPPRSVPTTTGKVIRAVWTPPDPLGRAKAKGWGVADIPQGERKTLLVLRSLGGRRVSLTDYIKAHWPREANRVRTLLGSARERLQRSELYGLVVLETTTDGLFATLTKPGAYLAAALDT